MTKAATNPFRFGALALDEAFTDREAEVAELVADARNGQDVVILAPRRYGKSSLVWKVASELVRRKVLVAQVDLMTTPSRARLADKLARAIHDDVASPLLRAKERLRVFNGLRVKPTITVDAEDGSPSFSFEASAAPADLDEVLERLLELPGRLAAERGRKVCLVLDEFQEVADIDPGLPRLMRSVFQTQPEVAHLYLGSKRHMMRRIFSDEAEPFWRSAKQVELGRIPREPFAGHIARRFAATGRVAGAEAVAAVLDVTDGHPYATQELCYFLWQLTPPGFTVVPADVEAALEGVLRSEHAHFSLLWERAPTAQRLVLTALSREGGRPLSEDYRRRHRLPGASTVQRALDTLEQQELVARDHGLAELAEPFLGAWIRRSAS